VNVPSHTFLFSHFPVWLYPLSFSPFHPQQATNTIAVFIANKLKSHPQLSRLSKFSKLHSPIEVVLTIKIPVTICLTIYFNFMV
jgi:hypothetical protein